MRLRPAFFLLLVLSGATGLGGSTVAAAAALDAGRDADTLVTDAEAADPAVRALRETAGHIRDLLAGKLATEISPRSLFDVGFDDESAMGLEAARLQALLRESERDTHRDAGRHKSGVDASDADASSSSPPSPELWSARLELDRARLDFYSLSPARRSQLLALDDTNKNAKGAPSEAERRAHEADQERQKALQTARAARSEAERIVSEELARLLDLERQQAIFEKSLGEAREETAKRREATLTWQRRAREARMPNAAAEAANDTYDDLRKALRVARDDLDVALDAVARSTSGVVRAGPDPIADLQTTVDTTAVRAERARVESAGEKLGAEETAFRKEHAAQLLDEIDALNSERLALLPFLSSDKRSSITGFTDAGFDQALSEVRQLSLIGRYHRYAATAWLLALRDGPKVPGSTVGGAVFAVIEWLCGIAAFIAMRRRTPIAFAALRKRAQASDRHERLSSPSPITRVVAFVQQVHRPVEWLLLAVVLSWLLPATARGLLEVQLVTVIVEWILGGALVVVVVDAIAGGKQLRASGKAGAPVLRLRSLRLVGRVVVAFGLVLVLTSRLVGPGTIYQWVLSTCWLSSVPVFLLLVRWWRQEVFERTEQIRRKTTFEKWVLRNHEGWMSFPAATAGGVYLFARGVFRAVRSWLSRFNVTRSVLAYLFRRKLDKLEAESADLATARIANDAFDALGPDLPSAEHIEVDVDEEVGRLAARLGERKGGVVAIVGSCGMGKSTILRDLHERFSDTLLMKAPEEAGDALRAALTQKLGLATDATLHDAAAALAASATGRALLLDDAHRYVQPLMGGLDTFDALLAAASRHSKETTWVIALDEVIWLFLQRARGGRPLFDTVIRLYPWREEKIIELLRARTANAGVTPSFDRLLEKLPPNADDIDRREALEERARSYYRLLWDYAAGNPGVALHMWRRSLGADPEGNIHVRFFQAPDTDDLDQLPDQTIFVLRAVLQLTPASQEEIGRATMLHQADIADALRYAQARMYISEKDGRYRVTWTWVRALSLFLKRRHLLVAS